MHNNLIMSNRNEFKLLTEIDLEKCIHSSIAELDPFENAFSLKTIKNKIFKAQSGINKERQILRMSNAASRVQNKIDELLNLSIEALQEKLLIKTPLVQFRNYKELDKDDLIKILEDYYILEEIENRHD